MSYMVWLSIPVAEDLHYWRMSRHQDYEQIVRSLHTGSLSTWLLGDNNIVYIMIQKQFIDTHEPWTKSCMDWNNCKWLQMTLYEHLPSALIYA